MKIQRVEQHQIKKSNPMWKIIDKLCFKSKNVYNYGNYIIRKIFIITSKLENNQFIDKEQIDFLKNINIKVDEYNKFRLENLKKKQIRSKCFNKQYKPLKYFNNTHKVCNYDFLNFILKDSEPFKNLGSNSSQQTLRALDKAWKSFYVTIKDWSKNSNKYLGRPKLPKYKDVNKGKFPLYLCNNQFKIIDNYIYFCWKPLKAFNNTFKTNIPKDSKLIQLRFIPRNNIYMMELVYEKIIPDINIIQTQRICGIDIGIDNFATLTNNVNKKFIIINGKIIKSINQYYNKKLAYYKSILKKVNNKNWSNKLDQLTIKHNNKIKDYMHKTSKQIIEYCKIFNLDTIIIGNNPEWKQNSKLNKKVNQIFVQIPYENFIDMIQYKAEDNGIKVIITEESYTSGTSFLDEELPIKENYNKNRRIFRGLFRSNTGRLINSDVNGSLQIIKKVISNAFSGYEIEGLDLTPLVMNL